MPHAQARVDELAGRGIKVTGADGKAASGRGMTASNTAGTDSSLALFDAVPAAVRTVLHSCF